MALAWLPSTLVDGQYVPVGMDSFYHARRILDALAHPFAVEQFDPRMHAPEGSWVTWPWAYDALMALAAATAHDLAGIDPRAWLAHVPPAWSFVNAALLLGCGAALGLRAPALALLGAGYALSPLTQMLHGAGVLDHHFVEYSFVLATLLLGLRWLQAPQCTSSALALGLVLGIAPAFHNGLFALQVPIDATLLLLWLRGEGPPPLRTAGAFGAALMLATLAAVLPSEPFRDGRFEFALLSGFHLYVAALSAAGALVLSWRPYSHPRLIVLAAASLAALMPVAADVLGGSKFLTATLVKLAEMQEAASVSDLYARGGLRELARAYGGLVFLLPFTAAAAVILLLRRPTPAPLRYAAAFALFGGGLLCFQWRLHYWGSAALFLPPLLALQRLGDRLLMERTRAALLGAAVYLAAVVPGTAGLWRPVPIGWSFDYMYSRGAFPALAEACAAHPGVVLADNNDGHPLRYHTDCAVISNNFILTPQHEQKLLLGDRLLALDARTLIEHHPWVDYVFVRRNDAVFEDLPPAEVAAQNPGLRGELLLGDGPWPPELELLVQVQLETGPGRNVILARAFRIHRAASRAATAP